MKQVIIKKGNAVVEDVPPPSVRAGFLLIKTMYSCISIGTEMSSIVNTSKSLLKRALENPDQAKQAVKMVTEQGISKTKQIVKGKLEAGNAVGYSAAGIVLEVGLGVKGFKPNDRVACAGTGYAYHAEFIVVPQNLVVKVPDNIDLTDASTVTLGAIALQGLRRANPTLGEIFVVLGLGALGQLTAQLLKNNGCCVIGIDLDSRRGEIALYNGLDFFISGKHSNLIEQVLRITDGFGADGIIITAATSSSEIVSQSFQMCRKKGRVVLVGDVGLELRRSDFYSKEIDFLISTSYGPGRYDTKYEEGGLDYPLGYVRWTENRNMQHFITLLGSGKVKLTDLIHKIFPIEEAPTAYELLNNKKDRPLMVLLYYPEKKDKKVVSSFRVIPNPSLKKRKNGKRVRIALIGAGGFAKGVHLPNIRSLSDLFQLKSIISRSGHNAKTTAAQYGAEYSGTDYHDSLTDPVIDAVIIATRHNLHSQIVLEALEAGKHVFVEKPLAIQREDLEKISEFYKQRKEHKSPLLCTGFNRRFSPYLKAAYDVVKRRTNPMIITYRMNAGYIPLDHWIHTEEGGGRNLSEACHIYDVFTYLTESEVVDVNSFKIIPTTEYYSTRDNFIAIINFDDGSMASLTYTALGSIEHPKEMMEIFVDGKTIKLYNYKKIEFYGTRKKPISTWTIRKGHKNELKAFGECILNEGKWPIPLWQQIQATEIALNVEQMLSDSKSN